MVRFDRVSSTQDVARKYAEDGREVVVVAEEQTGGRGRLGRKWFSPRGGLWFSVVLRRIETPVTLVCLAAGLAVAEAVEELTGLKPCLKWPNDVLINGRKVCGVLVEGKFTGEKLSYLIVGVGLNVNIPLDSFPPSIRGKATSLLNELGAKVNSCLLYTSPSPRDS